MRGFNPFHPLNPLTRFGYENFGCECFDIEYFVYEIVYHILT